MELKIVGPRAYVAEHLREHVIVRDLLHFLKQRGECVAERIQFHRDMIEGHRRMLDAAVREQLDIAFEIQRWEEAVRTGPDRLPDPPSPEFRMGPEDIR